MASNGKTDKSDGGSGNKIESQYSELGKKHSLPPFSYMEQDFDLHEIDCEVLTAKDIRKVVSEKMDHVAKLLEEVLQPDTHIASIYESKALDEDEKKQAFSTYRKLMKLYRKASELSISSVESEDAAFVREAFDFWSNSREDIKKIMRRLQESWESDIEQQDSQAYFG